MMMIIVYDWEDVKSTNLGSTAHVCILFEQDFFSVLFLLGFGISAMGSLLLIWFLFPWSAWYYYSYIFFNGFSCKESSIC